MKNNKKLIAIVVAIVLALIGLIVFIMKDSNEATSTQNQSGQLVNFQGADLQEEKDGKLVWSYSIFSADNAHTSLPSFSSCKSAPWKLTSCPL